MEGPGCVPDLAYNVTKDVVTNEVPRVQSRGTITMHVALLGLIVALAAEPCAALSGRRSVLRSRQPTLRALRGGATSLPFWVRNGTEGSLQLVHDLGAFCEENELDEEAMLAVSRGEAEEHDGYTCGVPSAYDEPPQKKKAATRAAVQAKEVSADEEEDGEEEAAEVRVISEDDEEEANAAAPAAKTPAPNMQKMLVGMLAPMGVLQVGYTLSHGPHHRLSQPPIAHELLTQLRSHLTCLQVVKRFDQKSPAFLARLRGVFFAMVAFNCLVQMLLDWRIKSTNDETLVAKPMNPIAMLMGGGGGSGKQTAAAYDREQLGSMRNSYRIGCAITCFLHFKMKMMQPIVYSSVSGLVDLYYHPLVNIHLFGKKSEGQFARPFGGAGPMGGGNPLGGLGGSPAAGAGGGAGGGLAALLNASRSAASK